MRNFCRASMLMTLLALSINYLSPIVRANAPVQSVLPKTSVSDKTTVEDKHIEPVRDVDASDTDRPILTAVTEPMVVSAGFGESVTPPVPGEANLDAARTAALDFISTQQNESTGFVESYTGASEEDKAHLFDQAVALIALSHAGQGDAAAAEQAELLAQALIDHQLREDKAPGDQYYGHWPRTLNCETGGVEHGDTDTGPNAWAGYALIFYAETLDRSNVPEAREAAAAFAHFAIDMLRRPAGYDYQWGVGHMHPSTEINLDMWWLLSSLGAGVEHDGVSMSTWADHLYNDALINPSGAYWTQDTTYSPGYWLAPTHDNWPFVPEDAQSWGSITSKFAGDSARQNSPLDFLLDSTNGLLHTEYGYDVQGVFYDLVGMEDNVQIENPVETCDSTIWNEGSAHTLCALNYAGRGDEGESLLNSLIASKIESNGQQGWYHSLETVVGCDEGFGNACCGGSHYGPEYGIHVGATSWAYFTVNCEQGDLLPYRAVWLRAPAVSGPTAPTSDNTPTWLWSSNGGNGHFRYSLDGGPWVETTQTTFTPASPFADGQHTLRIEEQCDTGFWSTSAYLAVQIDTVAPALIITAPSRWFAHTGHQVIYDLYYMDADSVSLSKSDVTLLKTGTANGDVYVTGTGTQQRKVRILNLTGNGTLALAIAAATGTDLASNGTQAVACSAIATVDNIPPQVYLSAPAVSSTMAGPVAYTMLFSGAYDVLLDIPDVTINMGGTAAADIAVNGAGRYKRKIILQNVTGDGDLGVSVASGTAYDRADNFAPVAGPSFTLHVDNTPPITTGDPVPMGSISAPTRWYTATDQIVKYVVAYTDADMITLTDADVVLNATGTATADLAVTGTGRYFRKVSLYSLAGEGTLSFSVLAGSASNTNGSADAFGPSAVVEVDDTGPGVYITPPSELTTSTGPVTYTVLYSDAYYLTLSEADVTLTSTGTANGTVSVLGTGRYKRKVRVSDITGNGTLGISLSTGTCIDWAGNPAPAATSDVQVKVVN